MKSLIILLFAIQITLAQEVKLVSTIPLEVDKFVGLDGYRNLYSIKNRVLYKQGPDGNFKFNDLQLGKITSVDIINPLNIVLFYQDTNTVVLLDNKLSEIDRVHFNRLPEFFNISTASNASINRLWVFNVDAQQLELFDYRNRFRAVVSQPFPGKIISQASNFNYCFVLTETKLRAFNVYGSLIREMEMQGYDKIVQQDENLLALKDNKLFYIYDFAAGKGETEKVPIQLALPEITIKDLQLTQDFLYIYDGKNLLTFTLTVPKQ